MIRGLQGLSVAGTVEYGETFETNIIKETKEEIWIDIKDPILLLKRRVVTEHSNYVGAIFYVQLPKNTPFVFDVGETQATKRMNGEEIDQRLTTHPKDFVPSFPMTWKLVNEKIKEMKL